MPYYPYRDRDSGGNWGSPESDAALGILQEFLPQLCARYRETDAFFRSVSPSLIPGGDALRRAIVEAGCFPYPTDPPEIPVQPPQPVYSQGGFSFGSITTRWRDLVLNNTFNDNKTWELPPNGNIGAPTSAPTLTTGINNFLRVSINTLRPGNEAGVDILSNQYAPERFQFLGILSYSVAVDNGAGGTVPPSNVLPPGYAPPQQGVPPVPIPRIPINVNIPQPPGFPDLNIPIEYSPQLAPDGSVSIPLTFAPVANFGWEPTFAPRIELSLGGVSIFGGGYSEPRQDLEELIQESTDCDCPDPCPPPGDDVDYQRIQNSLASVLSQRWRLPGFERNFSFGAFTPFSEAGRIVFDSDAIAVQIELDVTNYLGGGTPTINGVQGIGYYGWFTWIAVDESVTGSERHFLSSSGGVQEIPPYAIGLTFYCQNGCTARVRQVRLGDIPPA